MFDFFSRRTAKEYMDEAKDIYNMTIPKSSPENEHYRVGVTKDGMTTLTMMSVDGYSMTLSMNQEACEQMIRMLRATYQINQPVEE